MKDEKEGRIIKLRHNKGNSLTTLSLEEIEIEEPPPVQSSGHLLSSNYLSKPEIPDETRYPSDDEEELELYKSREYKKFIPKIIGD